MAPFYGWGSTPSRLEALQGGSLLLTTKFPFQLTMQDSHPSLYSTNTLYHLYISDPFC